MSSTQRPLHAAPIGSRPSAEDKAILAVNYADLKAAAIQQQIRALTTQLLAITRSKTGALAKAIATRTSTDESTKLARASRQESSGLPR